MVKVLLLSAMLLQGWMAWGQNMFPGAEGFGTNSRGAYAGDTLPEILYVDNLNDSGPGSLREAINKKFPRIVLFNVSGTIHSQMALIVNDPFLFVAGQSAPGKGISVVGSPFIVRTHDVLVQDIRFRLGASYPRQSDCVSIGGGNARVFNVVFDHCSFAFGLDENIGILNAGPGITISNSIIGYGLHKLGHSCGMLVDNSSEVSLIRNIFAFNHDRNPTINRGSTKVEVENNLIYNSASHAVYIGTRGKHKGDLELLLEKNLYITGPDNMNRYLLSIHANAPLKMNVFWNKNLTLNDGRVLEQWQNQLFDKSDRFAPMPGRPFENSVKELVPTSDLLGFLSERAGARPHNRDAVDSLIIEHIKDVSGFIINEESELSLHFDLPQTQKNICDDLPPKVHQQRGESKFTNLEIYLNQLLP